MPRASSIEEWGRWIRGKHGCLSIAAWTCQKWKAYTKGLDSAQLPYVMIFGERTVHADIARRDLSCGVPHLRHRAASPSFRHWRRLQHDLRHLVDTPDVCPRYGVSTCEGREPTGRPCGHGPGEQRQHVQERHGLRATHELG